MDVFIDTKGIEAMSDAELQDFATVVSRNLGAEGVFKIFAFVVEERIRRHAQVCQDIECGFNPLS